jgi:hypothetical protein
MNWLKIERSFIMIGSILRIDMCWGLKNKKWIKDNRTMIFCKEY